MKLKEWIADIEKKTGRRFNRRAGIIEPARLRGVDITDIRLHRLIECIFPPKGNELLVIKNITRNKVYRDESDFK